MLNRTDEILSLATSEPEAQLDSQYGVSSEVISKLCGCANLGADTEDDFVRNVLMCAETFTDDVTNLIKSLTDLDLDLESELYANKINNNINALRLMMNWEYDHAQIEQLARAEWREWQEQQEQKL